MTTQEMAPPVVAARSYSEIMRGEVKAECARRDINQRGVSALLGLSPQAVSDRWRGRTPWSLDEIESLESVLGLTRGSLLVACARRDSNPQPSDLSPLQVLLEDLVAIAMTSCFECRELGCGGELACDCGCHEQYDDLVDVGAFALGCGIDHNRVTECDECGKCTACHQCKCYDSNWWERVDAAPAAAARCIDWCAREGCTEDYLVPCECPCHGDIADLVATTAAAAWELAA